MSVSANFNPWLSLFGGAMIGLSAVFVMLFFGRIAGISGIALQAMRPFATRDLVDWGWRAAFIFGLFAAPLLVEIVTGKPVGQTVSDHLPGMAAAGLLVGFGTALGSGCTSGHGVCGLARLSYRSLVSVFTFTAVAFATVFLLRHLVGGGL